VTILARLEPVPSTDRRSSPRRKLCLSRSLPASGDAVTIHDFSCTGMLIETIAELGPFDRLQIDLPEVGLTQAIIIWSSGQYYGCEFTEPVSQAAISAAMLRSSPTRSNRSAWVELARPSVTPTAAEVPTRQDDDKGSRPGDDMAPLSVRLRVILGSAIVLWALIIWGARSVIKLIL
jgi:hypothetical protein